MFYFFKARVLKFLYEKKISHMDLKPENILLSSIHKPILKVAGRMNSSCFYSHDVLYRFWCGTTYWKAR
jgi:serine/threonine protein kinase